jgi:uncharacterized protein
MKHLQDPRRLDIAAFAKEGGTLAGEERLAKFERLIEESNGMGAENLLHFEAQGSVKADAAGVDEAWLHLAAHTTIALTCQRCLGPVDVEIQFERDFRFVATEELAEIEDEESEEDVLVLNRAFDLMGLVEDELLMDMPAAPKHDVCPQPVKMSVSDVGFVAETVKPPNPFAVLGKLKKDGLGD